MLLLLTLSQAFNHIMLAVLPDLKQNMTLTLTKLKV